MLCLCVMFLRGLSKGGLGKGGGVGSFMIVMQVWNVNTSSTRC